MVAGPDYESRMQIVMIYLSTKFTLNVVKQALMAVLYNLTHSAEQSQSTFEDPVRDVRKKCVVRHIPFLIS